MATPSIKKTRMFFKKSQLNWNNSISQKKKGMGFSDKT